MLRQTGRPPATQGITVCVSAQMPARVRCVRGVRAARSHVETAWEWARRGRQTKGPGCIRGCVGCGCSCGCKKAARPQDAEGWRGKGWSVTGRGAPGEGGGQRGRRGLKGKECVCRSNTSEAAQAARRARRARRTPAPPVPPRRRPSGVRRGGGVAHPTLRSALGHGKAASRRPSGQSSGQEAQSRMGAKGRHSRPRNGAGAHAPRCSCGFEGSTAGVCKEHARRARSRLAHGCEGVARVV